jgi:hypothetical protein
MNPVSIQMAQTSAKQCLAPIQVGRGIVPARNGHLIAGRVPFPQLVPGAGSIPGGDVSAGRMLSQYRPRTNAPHGRDR